MSHKLRHKKPQQNINKLNLTMYRKNYTPWPRGFNSRYAKLVDSQSTNIIHCINRLKKKKYMIISIDEKKYLTKSNIHS